MDAQMIVADLDALTSLKRKVDALDGPDLILDRELDRVLRHGKTPWKPWTSTVEAALTLFTERGLEPGDVLAEVCRHQAEIKGERFVANLPRAIISVGLGYLIRKG